MKKWQKILIWVMYGVAIAAATDLFNYFIEKNMLNTFNVLLIELIFLGLGYLCAILESRFKETKKRKKEMKKIISLLSLVVLSACAQATDAGNGLNRLDAEPKNCEYLYTIDSTATSYKLSGAIDYMEKSILEQDRQGDSYYIVKQDAVENPDAVFGPKRTFKFKVKVYNCQK